MAIDAGSSSGSPAFASGDGPGGHLYGRDTELRVLGALVDGVSSHGGASIVRGDAGIGKSSILAVVADHARAHGMQVLSAGGVQSEARLAYAGLHQVLRPVISLADALPSRQRAALLTAFAMSDEAAPEIFFIGLATLELLCEAAERAPILVIVEDAQWLDDASASVLAFVARRLEAEKIVMLIVIRDGHETSFDETEFAELSVQALDEEAAAALLDAHAPDLAAGIRKRVLEEAAGNPLALLELPVALDSGRHGDEATVASRLPLTARLERAFAAQESGLPSSTRSLLLVAAADEGGALSELLGAATFLEGAEVTADALTPAIAARLVERDSGTTLRFRHPLVRSAVYQAASVARRQAAHAALADALADQPDRRVWHRAAGTLEPNEEVAAELEEVAVRAAHRGAAGVAIAAQQRAAALSDPAVRGRRLLRAAEIAFEFGRGGLGQQLLQAAERLELSRPERTRLSWLREVFVNAGWSGSAKVAAFVEMAEQMRVDGRSDLALTTLLTVAGRCWWGNPEQETRATVVAAAERITQTRTDPRFLAILAYADPVSCGAFVIDQLAHETTDAGNPDGMSLLGLAAGVLGAYEESLRFLEPASDRLRAQGRLALLAQVLVAQAWGAVHLARESLAVSAAEEAAQLARETGQRDWGARAQLAQAAIAAERGDVELSESLAHEAEAILAPMGASSMLALVEFVRGRGAVAHQRYEEGLEYLRRPLDTTALTYHPFVGAWGLSDLVEAAAHTGKIDMAYEYLHQLESLAATTTAPFLKAQAGYARPLVASDDQAEALFQAAIQNDLANWPCLRGRMLLWYGRWLRRQRRIADSRAPLRAARDLFDALAFRELAEIARRELRASGETSRGRAPAAREELTPQELQIAQLAAEGLSNREIGQQLYISHRTVGYHLHRVFPKLGITSRTQLHPVLLGLISASA